MGKLNLKRIVGLFAVGVFVLLAAGGAMARAESPAVDPAAVRILKSMTDYLGSLKQFSVNTQNSIEDLTDSGHRVDYDVSAVVTVSRPNKLKARREGDLIDQAFYYNGKTLTLYNASDKVYATEPAPGTIEGMLSFARSSLGLIIPAADLIYQNNFQLLMQGRDPRHRHRRRVHRWSCMRSSALQPPGCRFPGLCCPQRKTAPL